MGGLKPLVVIVTVKLIILPSVCMAVSGALLAYGCLGDASKADPLYLFVLLVQSAMPSAQNLVVLFEVEGHSKAATRLSSAYMFQYLFAVVTMTWWVMVALAITES